VSINMADRHIFVIDRCFTLFFRLGWTSYLLMKRYPARFSEFKCTIALKSSQTGLDFEMSTQGSQAVPQRPHLHASIFTSEYAGAKRKIFISPPLFDKIRTLSTSPRSVLCLAFISQDHLGPSDSHVAISVHLI
jgi:hypothetical protein